MRIDNFRAAVNLMMKDGFDEWMAKVDHFVIHLTGLSADDLSDQLYYDWFLEGITPEKAAKRAIRNSKD